MVLFKLNNLFKNRVRSDDTATANCLLFSFLTSNFILYETASFLAVTTLPTAYCLLFSFLTLAFRL
jgi:hypothetical protein